MTFTWSIFGFGFGFGSILAYALLLTLLSHSVATDGSNDPCTNQIYPPKMVGTVRNSLVVLLDGGFTVLPNGDDSDDLFCLYVLSAQSFDPDEIKIYLHDALWLKTDWPDLYGALQATYLTAATLDAGLGGILLLAGEKITWTFNVDHKTMHVFELENSFDPFTLDLVISSTEPLSFYGISWANSSLTKYGLNGSNVVSRVSSASATGKSYSICASDDDEHVTIRDGPCATNGSKGPPWMSATAGYTDLEHFYMFTNESVYVFKYAAISAQLGEKVYVTKVALTDFFVMGQPNSTHTRASRALSRIKITILMAILILIIICFTLYCILCAGQEDQQEESSLQDEEEKPKRRKLFSGKFSKANSKRSSAKSSRNSSAGKSSKAKTMFKQRTVVDGSSSAGSRRVSGKSLDSAKQSATNQSVNLSKRLSKKGSADSNSSYTTKQASYKTKVTYKSSSGSSVGNKLKAN